LREHIGHFELEDHLVEDPKISVDIYNRYLKSRYHLLKMHKPDLEKGLSILEGIIEEQPNFALAYLSIHLGYILLGTLGMMPANEAFAKGLPYLDKAIELDENLPESQLNLSYICFIGKWDFEGAYRHLNKSFEIRPSVEYYQSMASILVAEGKFKAASNYIETALQLDPYSEINYHLKGFIFYTQEKYEPAIEQYEKGINLKPDSQVSLMELGQALLLMGRTEEGLDYFKNFPEDEPGALKKLGGTTMAFATLGDTAKAEAGIARLEAALQTDSMGSAINLLILCQAMLGNQEAAIKWIEQGVHYRLPMMVYLHVDPILKPLRSNPRFQALMGQVLGKETTFNPPERK
jgi:tetratricopeptide (TPR) repeat protein